MHDYIYNDVGKFNTEKNDCGKQKNIGFKLK